MADRTLDWRDELGRWLKPFLARLGHKARRLRNAHVANELSDLRWRGQGRGPSAGLPGYKQSNT